MRKILQRSLLAGLMFAMVLGVGSHMRVVRVHAQAQSAGVETTPEAQSPEKNKQEADQNDAYLHSPSVRKLGAVVGLNAEQAATGDESR